MDNKDDRVVGAFGEEWTRFSQEVISEVERQAIYNDYFAVFPWADIPSTAVGADIGCGSGRWAAVVAPRVGRLVCVDASEEALKVAARNLAGSDNVELKKADVGRLPFTDDELDFAYSLGVLHHVPDTGSALAEVARILRPGAPFLVYLYYAFDNRPLWFRTLWMLSDLARRSICRAPSSVRFFVCDLIALFVYWPLARLAGIFDRLSFFVTNFPLAYYRDKSFYVMRTDALDRFGTRLEKRFTRAEIASILTSAGFSDVCFSSGAPFWCAVGRKK